MMLIFKECALCFQLCHDFHSLIASDLFNFDVLWCLLGVHKTVDLCLEFFLNLVFFFFKERNLYFLASQINLS